MLAYTTRVEAGQVFLQFCLRHTAVARNQRKRKSSGHPDDALATRNSTQNTAQAVHGVESDLHPAVLGKSYLGPLEAADCLQRGRARRTRSDACASASCSAGWSCAGVQGSHGSPGIRSALSRARLGTRRAGKLLLLRFVLL